MIIYLALWLFNLWYILTNKTNKQICLITYLFMGLVFVSNDGLQGDASIYKEQFEQMWYSGAGFERGYIALEKIAHFLGINHYNGFLILLFAIVSLCIWIAFKKMNISYHYVFSLVLPFIFPTFSITIRFLVDTAIMIVAVKFLVEKKYVKYVLAVLLASSIHTTALFNIIFMLTSRERTDKIANKKKFILWFVVISAILSIIVFIITSNNYLIIGLLKRLMIIANIDVIKIEAYAVGQTHFGGLIFVFVYMIGLLSAVSNKKEADRVLSNKALIDNDRLRTLSRYAAINYDINISLAIVLPLLSINLLFYRLLIIGFITNAITVGLLYNSSLRENGYFTIKLSTNKIIYIISCITWFIPEVIKINDITIKGIIQASSFF